LVRRWLWPSFAFPGVLWLVLLFVVPFYAVLGVALGTVDPILFQPVPIWNPLEWNVGWLSEVLSNLAPGGIWFDVGVRTIVYVLISLALCLLIGYPVAYYTARHAGRWKGVILILIILPLWISYMMRMLAWVNLLQEDGYVNNFLTFTHVLSQPRDWLRGGGPAAFFSPPSASHPPPSTTPTPRPSSCHSSPRSIASTAATWKRHVTSVRAPGPRFAGSPSRSRKPASWGAPSSSRYRCSATTTRGTSSRARRSPRTQSP